VLRVIFAALVEAFDLQLEIILSLKFFFVLLEQKRFTIVLLNDLLHLDVASVLHELLPTV